MSLVKCLPYREGERFPYIIPGIGRETVEGWIDCDETVYEAWAHPDNIEDDEFNMVIMVGKCPVVVRSSHFDFVDE